MKCAFVVRLGPTTKPSEGRFEGWIEEVDTGKDLRFRSKEELLDFLGRRFQARMADEPTDERNLLDSKEDKFHDD
jgi:hypothetical protein